MGASRDELQKWADEKALRDYEGAAAEPTPFDEPVKKTPCENCTVPSIGRLCKACNRSNV